MPTDVTVKELNDLNEQYDKLLAEARTVHDSYNDAEDRSSPEATEAYAKYERMLGDLDSIEEKRKDAIAKIERDRDFQDRQDRHNSVLDDIKKFDREDIDPNAPQNPTGSTDLAEDRAYTEAYVQYLKFGGDGMSGEQRDLLARGSRDQVEGRTVSTAVSSNVGGGNLIPTTLHNVMVDYMKFYGPIVPGGGLCFDWSTSLGESIDIPIVDDADHTGEAVTQAKRVAGGTSAGTDLVGEEDPDFKKVTSTVAMYDSKMVKMTREFVQDSQPLEIMSVLGQQLGRRLGRAMNTAFTKSVISAIPSGNQATQATGNPANVEAESVIALSGQIDPAYRGVGVTGAGMGNLTFMMSDAVYQGLRVVKAPFAGTSSAGYSPQSYLFTVSGNIIGGDPDRLNGRPFAINQAMDGLVKSKNIMTLGDFSNVWVRSAGPVMTERTDHLYLERLMIGVISFQRAGVVIVNPNTLALLKTPAS